MTAEQARAGLLWQDAQLREATRLAEHRRKEWEDQTDLEWQEARQRKQKFRQRWAIVDAETAARDVVAESERAGRDVVVKESFWSLNAAQAVAAERTREQLDAERLRAAADAQRQREAELAAVLAKEAELEDARRAVERERARQREMEWRAEQAAKARSEDEARRQRQAAEMRQLARMDAAVRSAEEAEADRAGMMGVGSAGSLGPTTQPYHLPATASATSTGSASKAWVTPTVPMDLRPVSVTDPLPYEAAPRPHAGILAETPMPAVPLMPARNAANRMGDSAAGLTDAEIEKRIQEETEAEHQRHVEDPIKTLQQKTPSQLALERHDRQRVNLQEQESKARELLESECGEVVRSLRFKYQQSKKDARFSESKRNSAEQNAAEAIQRVWRVHEAHEIVKQKRLHMRSAVIVQRVWRRTLRRIRAQRNKRAAQAIQGFFRTLHRRHQRHRQAAFAIQGAWRTHVEWRDREKIAQRNRAAIAVQRNWRGYLGRKRVKEMQAQRAEAQRRREEYEKHLKKMQEEEERRRQQRLQIEAEKKLQSLEKRREEAVKTLQRVMRGHFTRTHLRWRQAAAVRIQCVWRRRMARQLVNEKRRELTRKQEQRARREQLAKQRVEEEAARAAAAVQAEADRRAAAEEERKRRRARVAAAAKKKQPAAEAENTKTKQATEPEPTTTQAATPAQQTRRVAPKPKHAKSVPSSAATPAALHIAAPLQEPRVDKKDQSSDDESAAMQRQKAAGKAAGRPVKQRAPQAAAAARASSQSPPPPEVREAKEPQDARPWRTGLAFPKDVIGKPLAAPPPVVAPPPKRPIAPRYQPAIPIQAPPLSMPSEERVQYYLNVAALAEEKAHWLSVVEALEKARAAFEETYDLDNDQGAIQRFEELVLRIVDVNNTIAQDLIHRKMLNEANKTLQYNADLTAHAMRAPSLESKRAILRAGTYNVWTCLRKAQGNLRGALNFTEKALSIMLELNLTQQLPSVYLNICALYSTLGLHAESLKHAYVALQVVKDLIATASKSITSGVSHQSPTSHTGSPYHPSGTPIAPGVVATMLNLGAIDPSAEGIESEDERLKRYGTQLAISYFNIAVEQEYLQMAPEAYMASYRLAMLTAEDFLGPVHPLTTKFRQNYRKVRKEDSAAKTEDSVARVEALQRKHDLFKKNTATNAGVDSVFFTQKRHTSPSRASGSPTAADRSVASHSGVRGVELRPKAITPPPNTGAAPRRLPSLPQRASSAEPQRVGQPHPSEVPQPQHQPHHQPQQAFAGNGNDFNHHPNPYTNSYPTPLHRPPSTGLSSQPPTGSPLSHSGLATPPPQALPDPGTSTVGRARPLPPVQHDAKSNYNFGGQRSSSLVME